MTLFTFQTLHSWSRALKELQTLPCPYTAEIPYIVNTKYRKVLKILQNNFNKAWLIKPNQKVYSVSHFEDAEN